VAFRSLRNDRTGIGFAAGIAGRRAKPDVLRVGVASSASRL